ncbi:hypothetical protein RGE_12360 [Rubrivivax gelatinosus IL144]|uniref:Uncharacterized protein n=1 Tax=Rubrivivax gelatinosus (strain NBRC 100245 / IL144) TaxID=983917 RepID=I0HNJ0_RUBGI|nr:hypothetical protein RGE_12360 [Rubrivivax gelatinosus IL144]
MEHVPHVGNEIVDETHGARPAPEPVNEDGAGYGDSPVAIKRSTPPM